jgi:hypothetical protein
LEEITINYLHKPDKIFKIVPLNMQRDWMHQTSQKFAYKCLPLGIANQYGWAVLAPFDFKVSWYGGDDLESVDVWGVPEEYEKIVTSHFANKTFTLAMDFIVKTPPGYSIYIRGIPNKEYRVAQPLDAIVETDWLPFTFTYNFRFFDTGTIEFKKDEPIFCFFPILRNTVENFEIRSQFVDSDPELQNDFMEYARSRDEHQTKPRSDRSEEFQKFYIDGRGPGKWYDIKDHLKRVFFKTPRE